MPEYVTNRESPAIPDELNQTTDLIIGAAVEVHRHLGPGLLEGVYEHALVHELRSRGAVVHQQALVKVIYKDIEIEGQRLDLLVEPGVIVEIKAVEHLAKTHEAQLMSYLKSTDYRVGLLINFNQALLKNGIKRLVN